MEKRFHLFVRRHAAGGATVSVIQMPHLAAFGETSHDARSDLNTVLERLLERDLDGVAQTEAWWQGLVARRVDLVIRARQRQRLLPVPMRFTVLVRPLRPTGERAKKVAEIEGPIAIHVPRLGLEDSLDDAADLDAHVEEMIRHALYMVPLAQLRELAWDGSEAVETLTVRYKPRDRRREAEKAVAREKAKPPRREVPPALAEASRFLNEEVALGHVERAAQREPWMRALIEMAVRSRRASVMLVGAAGAGKTALVHELVHRAEEAAPRSALGGLEVYSTSGARVVAGMRYLGEWQERLQAMLSELRTRKAVLHIESLTEFLASFGTRAGMDGATYLLPAIESGDVAVICETTPEDLVRAERSHGAFVRAFRALRVEALSGSDAWLALSSVAQRVAKARGVRFEPDALQCAMDLTERFHADRPLPGSAVRLLRTTAAMSPPPVKTKGGRVVPRALGAAAVVDAFCKETGFPTALADPKATLDPEAVLERLRARVIGQDHALTLLRDLVVTMKTGLSDASRPPGTFLLLGPTGVGKTESVLALGEYLFGDVKRVVRFDMSEYAAPGSAARLAGAGAGEGTLARRVREQPFGIVLLDEVEKADAGVHDLLLQVLGEGRLTDATGHTVSFCNTVVMMTSNLGAEGAGRALGFGDPLVTAQEAHYRAAAAAFFRPELLNRIDHIVPYRALSAETVAAITRRALDEALAREGLSRRGITVRYDDAVVAALAAQGIDPKYGARPLKRVIERRAVAPLATLLAARSDRPPKGLRLRAEGGDVVIDEEGAAPSGEGVA